MVKRYEGNTGRVQHLEDAPPVPVQAPRPEPAGRGPQPAEPPRRPDTPLGQTYALPPQLRRLLSGMGELETEDLLLLLILYLLYRESGDQDWLVTLGAMLFL